MDVISLKIIIISFLIVNLTILLIRKIKIDAKFGLKHVLIGVHSIWLVALFAFFYHQIETKSIVTNILDKIGGAGDFLEVALILSVLTIFSTIPITVLFGWLFFLEYKYRNDLVKIKEKIGFAYVTSVMISILFLFIGFIYLSTFNYAFYDGFFNDGRFSIERYNAMFNIFLSLSIAVLIPILSDQFKRFKEFYKNRSNRNSDNQR